MKSIVAPGTRVYNFHTADVHTYFANGVAVHNTSGAQFVDLSNIKGLKRLEWNSHAPEWRIAMPGICFEDKCTNASCKAYKQQLIINIGFKKFDYLTDVSADTSKCLVCSSFVEPETCAFNNCTWKWWGIKQSQSGMPPEKVSADWRIADNAYHRFDQDVAGTVTWRQLFIEAKPN
ncbi:unnamed protein product [Didymodactylos carnosus]|uniref:Intein C-terminal splicing domain-containing protein n=1 Tax=Didymodactylos carnosus TaxID=1234261 RepID=A0A814UZC3_9BILA|nr:unnamed protein product [Didymodactylos carnosus]CAF1219914.1 unnamed protein product [Didymodactylos carnosus]CAF3945204.1 unnamed protein product [Didymodactylos carnosus]CAF4028033.1 unnamed protein product [Didymodactylos carnosus]